MIKKHYKSIIVIAVFVLVFIYIFLRNWNIISEFISQSGKQYDKRIAVVTIDMDSIADIDKGQHRRHLGELIGKIAADVPAVIGVNYLISNESDDQNADLKLAESISKAGKVIRPSSSVFKGIKGRIV